MGASCSNAADAWVHLASKDELREAVKSIEAWQKSQEQIRATGAGPRALAGGPLLQRVGGVDVVKQVIESFYRKLYANERLLTYLHDKDMVYLRAKQTAFMSWLFGSSNQPYAGKHLRTVHLRIIKQRGFSPEDFDLGMEYFEVAMREVEAPEIIITEVMRKVRPFKEVIFTPNDKDAEEEARWAFVDRMKQQQQERQQQQQQQLATQQSMHQGQKSGLILTSKKDLAAVGVGAVSNASRGAAGPQCPFTGGRMSHPGSGTGGGYPAANSPWPTKDSPEVPASAPATPPTPPAPVASPAAAAAAPSPPPEANNVSMLGLDEPTAPDSTAVRVAVAATAAAATAAADDSSPRSRPSSVLLRTPGGSPRPGSVAQPQPQPLRCPFASGPESGSFGTGSKPPVPTPQPGPSLPPSPSATATRPPPSSPLAPPRPTSATLLKSPPSKSKSGSSGSRALSAALEGQPRPVSPEPAAISSETTSRPRSSALQPQPGRTPSFGLVGSAGASATGPLAPPGAGSRPTTGVLGSLEDRQLPRQSPGAVSAASSRLPISASASLGTRVGTPAAVAQGTAELARLTERPGGLDRSDSGPRGAEGGSAAASGSPPGDAGAGPAPSGLSAGAEAEPPARSLTALAVEVGLESPRRVGTAQGSDGGAAAAAAAAAATSEGGVELVDDFLTEVLQREAMSRATACAPA